MEAMLMAASISPLSQHLSALFFRQKSAIYAITSNCSRRLVPLGSIIHRRHQLWCSSTTSFRDSHSHVTRFAKQGVRRDLGSSAKFDPCIWDNHFLAYDDPSWTPVTANEDVMKEHEELKEEVRKMLVSIETIPSMMPLKTKLRLIDTIQRLGVSFHFEKEIINILQQIYEANDIFRADDLYTVSIGFRLVRQQGIYIPAKGLFEKFVDDIDEQLTTVSSSAVCGDDVEGLLALYETSYYAIDNEDILDLAQEVANNKLRLILPELQKYKPQLGVLYEKVERCLQHCSIGRDCDRPMASFYIPIYKQELTFGDSLLKFSVHDFNIRQANHKKELAALTKWCEETCLKQLFPFARHRLVEFYFYMVCIYPEPEYKGSRIISTQWLFVLALIDDMYDTYGKMEELEQITEPLASLNPNGYELPHNIESLIRVINKLCDEVDQFNAGRPYVVYFLKREYKRLVWAYLNDARWVRDTRIISLQEYQESSMITTCRTMLPCMYMAGMGDIVSLEAMSWAMDNPIPKFIEASAIVCRYLDDLSLNSNELEKPQTAIPVFMTHYGVSEEEARNMVRQVLRDAYKEMTKGLLKDQTIDTSGIPRPILKAIYRHNLGNEEINRNSIDKYSVPRLLKNVVSSVLVEPMAI